MHVFGCLVALSLGMIISASAQTTCIPRDPSGRGIERVYARQGGAVVAHNPSGQVVRIGQTRAPTTVVTDRCGRTVALVTQPTHPRAPILVRDPSGRVVPRIQRSPCGRYETIIDRNGRVLETRQILPNGTVIVRTR